VTTSAGRPAPFPTPYVLSWTFSILMHGLALGSVFMLLTDFRLAPRPEPFKWDVSVLEPSPIPRDKQPVPSQSRTSPAPQVEQEPIKPQPVVQTAPEAAQQEVRTTTPVIQAALQPSRAEPQIIAHTTQPIQTPPPAAIEQPVAPAAATQPAPTASAPAATAARMPESASAPGPSPVSTVQTKRDYGWLTEALWGRIEQMKRYPASARLNRWEGKVVLRAVIMEDGHIADLRIAQSSGHDVLDQDALGLIQQVSPIPLKQPLGRPQVVVHIPISYKLEQ
jgi:protein TonB